MIAITNRSKFSFLKTKRCIFFAFSTALCWMLMVSTDIVLGAEAASSAATSTGTQSKGSEKMTLDVIELTSKNFGSLVGVGDGNVWLIEFYTPTCSHCVEFAPAYKRIAATFHDSPEQKVRIARVNCSVEKALMTRFGIQAFPSFYLASGWDIYEFDGNRNVSTLLEFAKGGYKKKKPISFMNSPMGPMGLLQGALIFVGTRAMGLLDDLHENYGIPPIFTGVIICIVGVCCGMISIILLTVLSIPRGGEKND
mmetsp:Transcript_7825/g.16789  ORF Transcript_7825/g.16789 Transcript_7825/m.16789 type:complete len:253 (+) Transcript_7825:123-881(+)